MTLYLSIGLHTLPAGESNFVGDMRLVGSSVNGEGAVEIYSPNGWTSICPDNWNTDDGSSRVICQRLGYEDGEATV